MRFPTCGICGRELEEGDLYLVLPRAWFPWVAGESQSVMVCDRCLAVMIGAGFGLFG